MPKKRLIIVLSRFPFPLEKGDKLRAFNQIRTLSEHFDIHLFCTVERSPSQEHLDQLLPFCREIHTFRIRSFQRFANLVYAFFFGLPLQIGYFYSRQMKLALKNMVQNNQADYLYCQLVRTAEHLKNLHHIPKTIDYMDALSAGVKRRISRQGLLSRWIFRMEYERLAKYERNIFHYFEQHTIISEQDRWQIQHSENSKIHCIPNGISSEFFENGTFQEKYDFVFVGNMSYPPNIDVVHYIARFILPEIPGSTLLIAGASPHSSVLSLADKNPNIHVSGWIDDIRNAYRSGKIFLAPMQIGTGMQNKILEAMALGIPCITSKLAAEPLGATNGLHLLSGESTDVLVAHCKNLLNDPVRRKEIASEAQLLVKQTFSWEKSAAELAQIIRNSPLTADESDI